MAGVTFTPRGAERIKKAVRRVEAMPRTRAGGPTPVGKPGESFWAMILGSDITGLRFTYLRVIPTASQDEADFILGRDLGLFYQIASETPELGYAREANGNRDVPMYTVTKVDFIGLDQAGEPAFLFVHGSVKDEVPFVPPHDHRDNYNGGMSFSIYHPGTSLPQQPWAH